jgi:hypothetical protein
MKSEEKIDFAKKLSSEIDLLVKSLVNGKGTDDRLFEIEMKIKYLNQQLVSLAESEPMVKSHSENIKSEQPEFDWSFVVNSLK